MEPESKKLSFKSLGWLSIINLGIAVIGALQTVVIATIFGATRTVEIFFAATTFQYMLLSLASSGQIGDLFTPIFHDIQVAHGKRASREAFSVMTNVMMLIGTAITLVGVVFANVFSNLLVPGFTVEQIALCAIVFMITAPLALVHVTNGMFSNLLRAEHHYGVDESLGLASRITNLAVVIAFGWSWGIWALVLGTWLAALVRLAGQIIYARRQGYRHRLVFTTKEFHPGFVLRKIPFTFCHIFSAQFFAFAMTAGLSFLPQGSLAIYTYAKQLHAKFQGLILQPVGILFFNRFSQALAEGTSRVKDYATHALALSAALVTLSAVPVICGGDYLLLGLWRGEEFSVAQIQDTHMVLVALTLMLIGSAQYLISRRTNLALKVVARQFIASGAVMIAAGVSCYWIIPAFGIWGAVAIQFLAIAGTALATLGVLWFVNKELVAVIPVGRCFLWLVAGGAAVVATLALRQVVPVEYEASRWQLLLAACGFGLFSLVTCATVSWLLGIPESKEILEKVSSRLGNRGIRHA